MNRVCHMKRGQSPMSPYNASVYCQRICLRGQNVEQNDLGIIRLMGVCVWVSGCADLYWSSDDFFSTMRLHKELTNSVALMWHCVTHLISLSRLKQQQQLNLSAILPGDRYISQTAFLINFSVNLFLSQKYKNVFQINFNFLCECSTVCSKPKLSDAIH